jgi:tetratricopeptide (TPR) repeat protein
MSTDVQISGDREFQLQSGISLAQAGKLEDAATEFNALLAGNNRDTDALNNLAIVYRRQGKSQDALGALLEAVDIDPTRAEFQHNLGKVYKQLGNFKSAAMACAKAIENDPSLVPAYINLGAAYYLLHEFGKAVNFFKKGLDRDPANRILRANYEAALEAKQAAETAGASSADLPPAEISEAGDIFMGAPVPADAAIPANAIPAAAASAAIPANAVPAGTASAAAAENAVPAAAAGVPVSVNAAIPADAASAAVPAGTAALPETASSYTLGDIRGLLRYLMGLADFFSASGRRIFDEQGIEQRIKNISNALSSLEEDAPLAIPGAEPAAGTAGVSAPAGDDVSIASLAGMLNQLERLARDLPQTEQRDILKQKMESLIEELTSAALER